MKITDKEAEDVLKDCEHPERYRERMIYTKEQAKESLFVAQHPGTIGQSQCLVCGAMWLIGGGDDGTEIRIAIEPSQ